MFRNYNNSEHLYQHDLDYAGHHIIFSTPAAAGQRRERLAAGQTSLGVRVSLSSLSWAPSSKVRPVAGD